MGTGRFSHLKASLTKGTNALNVAIENLTKLGRDSQLILKQREARLVMECVEKLETK